MWQSCTPHEPKAQIVGTNVAMMDGYHTRPKAQIVVKNVAMMDTTWGQRLRWWSKMWHSCTHSCTPPEPKARIVGRNVAIIEYHIGPKAQIVAKTNVAIMHAT